MKSGDRDERSYQGKHRITAAVLLLQMFISLMGRLVSDLSPPDSGVFLSITWVSHVLCFCFCFYGGPSWAGVEEKSWRCHLGDGGPVL